LPGQSGAGRLSEDRTELQVFDLRDLGAEIGRERLRWGDAAKRPALRWPVDGIHRADAKTDARDRDAARSDALEELLRQHLELVRPDARGHEQHEDATLDHERPRAVGDARSYRSAPFRDGDRKLLLREPILPGALDQLVDRLGRFEVLAPRPFAHGGGW
jgi:hypothetical protein